MYWFLGLSVGCVVVYKVGVDFGFLGFLGVLGGWLVCACVVMLLCCFVFAAWCCGWFGLLLVCFLVFCWYLLMWFCVLLVVYIWLFGLGMFGGACCIAALVGCLLGLLVDCWF